MVRTAIRTGVAACALLAAACGSQPLRTTARPPATVPQRIAPAPAAAATASPAPTPGDFGGTSEGLTFQWEAGYAPPAWLPASIQSAPAAPSGGSTVCGPDPATSLYTALIRYSPSSAAGAITIQVHAFTGPGTYVSAGASSVVDVEVSPPAPDLTGLSGFGVSGATVHVNADLVSGTVSSPLLLGERTVGSVTGQWRCA